MDFDFWHETYGGKLHATGNYEKDRKIVTFEKIETELGEDILPMLTEIAPIFLDKLCKKIEEEWETGSNTDFMDRDGD